MSHSQPVGIQAAGVLSALGNSTEAMLAQLHDAQQTTLSPRDDLISGRTVYVGGVQQTLPEVPAVLARYASRNLALALAALEPMQVMLESVKSRFPAPRLAIVLGTSTSGIAEGEVAIAQWLDQQTLPAHYHYAQQEMGSLALALRLHLGWQGPAYCISTACSASAKAMASAQRLLNAGLVDAVLTGGVDSLCRLTLNGFDSLDSLSASICRPFSGDRDGINIGEAAALFLLTRDQAPVMLLGAGESSDAHHISAPHPEGLGAEAAMQRALTHTGLAATDIHYLNLHGTATRQNDAMEAKAVHRLFADTLPVSSTKQRTGHCLGAAGALEAGIALALLSELNPERRLPIQNILTTDEQLPALRFVSAASRLPEHGPARIMSNSFAFGGNNIALILERV